jgi:hypothetical protein
MVTRKIIMLGPGGGEAKTAVAAYGNIKGKFPRIRGAGHDALAGPHRFQIVAAATLARTWFKGYLKHFFSSNSKGST